MWSVAVRESFETICMKILCFDPSFRYESGGDWRLPCLDRPHGQRQGLQGDPHRGQPQWFPQNLLPWSPRTDQPYLHRENPRRFPPTAQLPDHRGDPRLVQRKYRAPIHRRLHRIFPPCFPVPIPRIFRVGFPPQTLPFFRRTIHPNFRPQFRFRVSIGIEILPTTIIKVWDYLRTIPCWWHPS